MTILALYAIGVLLVFLFVSVPYMVSGDGLELFGAAIGAFTALIWPLVLVLLLWDGFKLCLKKLSII